MHASRPSRSAPRSLAPQPLESCCRKLLIRITPRAKLWASQIKCERSELQKTAHQLQRSLGRLHERTLYATRRSPELRSAARALAPRRPAQARGATPNHFVEIPVFDSARLPGARAAAQPVDRWLASQRLECDALSPFMEPHQILQRLCPEGGLTPRAKLQSLPNNASAASAQ